MSVAHAQRLDAGGLEVDLLPCRAEEERRARESLLVAAAKARLQQPEETKAEQVAKEEEDIFKHITARKALMAAKELALGVEYTESLSTGWKPPLHIRKMNPKRVAALREKLHIEVEGEDIPPPVERFEDLRLPPPVLRKLRERGIQAPFKIQIQGLPIALSGRDMIGISYTGSGKTLAFVLPMIAVGGRLAAMARRGAGCCDTCPPSFLPGLQTSWQEETRLPLQPGEGPIGFVLCPSRELARQTYEQALAFSEAMREDGYGDLRCILCMGGVDAKEQTDMIRRQGVHMIVATPGRLKDYLHKKKITFDHCRFVCLDEADRMVDLGFEEDIRDIWSFFRSQRQTLMFSATMPAKIMQFAESALVRPVTVKVSRAGAANANIIQQVEYVKAEHRLPFVLECLGRTPPPVLIFAENKADVDDIHEYLLVKGVEAVAVHGSKSQEERDMAISQFKTGKADVLVATDVASKGLDFANVQHVINYDMPKDIENYVHRIGRTGRGESKGLATTFINKTSSESILLDLKGLLKEAGQRIPPLLQALEDPQDIIAAEAAALTGQRGCVYW